MALTNAERQKRWRDRRNALAAKAEGPTWRESAVYAVYAEYTKIVRERYKVPKGTCDADLQTILSPDKRITWAEIIRLLRPALQAKLESQIEAVRRLRNGQHPGITYYSENAPGSRLGGRVSRAQFEAEHPEAKEAIARNEELAALIATRRRGQS